MDFYINKKRKKALLTTVPMPEISIINQVPGRIIRPNELDSIEDCLIVANNESFLGGRSQPAIGLHFLKENVPSVDILEFPKWDDYEEALKNNYDVVGISFYTTHFYAAKKMAKMAKEAGIKEVWAGNFGALTPGVSDYFDRAFIGCAENDLKIALENEAIKEVKHPVITTPFSAVLRSGEKAGYIFTSRGCKFKCEFCCSPIFFQGSDTISLSEIERVLDIYRDMGINYINVGDETFLQNHGHAKKVINLMHKRDMKWFCTSRADLILGNVEELKEKGFNSVYMGIESMNDDNLLDQNKGQYTEKIIAVLDELKHYGISTSGTYILGLDKDTKESIKNDLERLNKLLINILIFIIFTPYPELPLYPKWKKDGKIIHDNWKEYDGLHMVFKHPFLSPEEAKETLNYAVCNVYSPYNYNKRRVLRRLDQLKREKESLKVQTREVLTIKN